MQKKGAEEQKKPRRRIKKVKGHGGHHGGAWKVAYADFVTAMMALFLVLWLVSQADTKLKEAIANYFRSPGVFDTMKGGILPNAKKVSKEPENLTANEEEKELFGIAETLKKKFETRPEFEKLKDRVQIELTDEGLKIEILDKAEKVSFEIGSAELTEEAELILSEIATAVCELPNPIMIGGHTDKRVFQSNNGYSNWELSADRANAARRFLVSQCVSPQQIRRIVGFADSQPLLPNDPYSPANRRISITVARIALEKTDNETDNNKPADEDEAKSTENSNRSNSNTEKSNKKSTVVGNVNKTSESKKSVDAEKKALKTNANTVEDADQVPTKPEK